MTNKRKLTYRQLILSSVIYVTISVLMFSCVTYAWFTIINENHASLVSNISEIEAEYDFYIYKNSERSGSQHLTLIDNVCQNDESDLCYYTIPNPTYPFLIDGSVAPGERYSFAIGITSVNNAIGYLKLDFGGLESLGYDLEINKMQIAFEYEVKKISYINDGIESEDKKDQLAIVYHQSHFTYDNDTYYPLTSNIPMQTELFASTHIVVYFDIYFDPSIYGQTPEGIMYTNSNIFSTQSFTIHNIFMSVST